MGAASARARFRRAYRRASRDKTPAPLPTAPPAPWRPPAAAKTPAPVHRRRHTHRYRRQLQTTQHSCLFPHDLPTLLFASIRHLTFVHPLARETSAFMPGRDSTACAASHAFVPFPEFPSFVKGTVE